MYDPTLISGRTALVTGVIDGRLNAVMAGVSSRLPESMILGLASRLMKRTMASREHTSS